MLVYRTKVRFSLRRNFASRPQAESPKAASNTISGKLFVSDDFTNVTPKILSHVGVNLHNKTGHPLLLVKKRIVQHIYERFKCNLGKPDFSVLDGLSPIVSSKQNFDDLLIPENHVSRSKTDCYYINSNYLLRGHMTCHQVELIKMGLNNFLMVGDVYRRDEIDSTHYPVFHQVDAVRLCTKDELSNLAGGPVTVFETNDNKDTPDKQSCHTLDASKIMEQQLKTCLVTLAQNLFGPDVRYRWVEVYFPFTHPSWELEILQEDRWLEVLGCGIMRQEIATNGGAGDRIGWAFGMGLERLAMILYSVPDIRLFWSQDTGFISQFFNLTPESKYTFKPVSIFPQCKTDISFWLPENKEFHSNDFYELAREVGGSIVEQVSLVDEFRHPKTGRVSHCYRIIYRDLERTLTQKEVNNVHQEIGAKATQLLGVTVR